MSDEGWVDVPAPTSSAPSDDGWTDVAPVATKAPEAPSGLLTRTEDDGWMSGAAKGAATAVIKGAANIPGVYGNVRDFGRYLADRALTGIGGMSQEQIDANRKKFDSGLSHDWIPSGADIAKPALEKTGDYVPETTLGKVAQAGLETAVGSIGPGSGGLAKGAPVKEAMLSMAKPGAAGMNALAGGAGEAATEFTGDPLYGFGASILSGPAAHAGKHYAFDKGIGAVAAPYFQGLKEKLAADQLQGYAEDPAKFRDSVLNRPDKDRILEGSPLTTGQAHGDAGILEAERQFRGDDEFKHKINDQEARQNEARVNALKDIPSDSSNVHDLVGSIEARHQEITDRFNKAEEKLRANAEKEAASLGEQADPMEIGNRLRSEIQKIREQEQAEIGKLYDAVDPNGDLRLLTTPLKEGIKEIEARRTESTNWSPGLEGVLELANNAPEVWSLKELRGLDKRLTDEMSAERRSAGETESWSGLKILKGKVKDAINNAVEHQQAWEKAAGIAPEDGIEGRFRQSNAGTDTAAAEGDASTGSRAAAVGEAEQSGPLAGSNSLGETRPQNGGSRDVGSGQGLAEEAGRDHKIFHPGGNLNAKYEVVELGDLIASHDTDFKENPNFPQELQPRDRSSKPAQDQVNEQSSKLNPELLGRSAEANTGAPIVGPDGIVESGNGRTLMITKNYAAGDPRGYKAWLESQGYDVSGMKQPVLIARRTSEMTPAERQAFTQNANTSTGLQMSATERAAADSRFLTPEVLAKLQDGALDSEANADFISSLMSKIPVNERGSFGDKNGKLSSGGLERLKAAIVHAAFGDSDIVTRGFESADNNIKNITGALTDVAGSWAKMRAAARDGEIAPEHDVTPQLLEAVKKIMKARDEGRPLKEMMPQRDMLVGDTPELVEALLIKNGKVVSRQQLAKNLDTYAQEALKNQSGGLFESDVTPEKILRTVGEKEQLPPETETAAKTEAPKEEQATFADAEKLTPNMTKESAEKLSEANQRYGEYSQTYRKGDVGNVLRTTGFKDQYQVKDSAVAARAVRPGDTGYETASNFFNASKNSPGSVDAMKEMLLNHFRNAVGPDGILNSKNYSKLVQKYDGVIRAIEERSPGFMKDVNNAKKASDMLDAFAIRRKEALDSLHKEAASKFLGLSDAHDIENHVGRLLEGAGSSVDKMRSIVKDLPPEALDGMRRAAIDWMTRTKTNAARAGTGDTAALSFAKIDKLLKNSPVLEVLFTPEQMDVLRAIRDDMVASDRSVQATRDRTNPSGSARSAAKHLGDAVSDLGGKSMFAIAMGTLYHAWETGGVQSVATVGIPMLGIQLAKGFRTDGVNAINDVVKQALLDPQYAREILKKTSAPKEKITRSGDSYKKNALRTVFNGLATSLYRTYTVNPVVQEEGKRQSNFGVSYARPGRKEGGRIGVALTPEQLISGIERARNMGKKQTESILNKPDEAVVRALSLADQHI
jgi:hypothetical protein